MLSDGVVKVLDMVGEFQCYSVGAPDVAIAHEGTLCYYKRGFALAMAEASFYESILQNDSYVNFLLAFVYYI